MIRLSSWIGRVTPSRLSLPAINTANCVGLVRSSFTEYSWSAHFRNDPMSIEWQRAGRDSKQPALWSCEWTIKTFQKYSSLRVFGTWAFGSVSWSSNLIICARAQLAASRVSSGKSWMFRSPFPLRHYRLFPSFTPSESTAELIELLGSYFHASRCCFEGSDSILMNQLFVPLSLNWCRESFSRAIRVHLGWFVSCQSLPINLSCHLCHAMAQ